MANFLDTFTGTNGETPPGYSQFSGGGYYIYSSNQLYIHSTGAWIRHSSAKQLGTNFSISLKAVRSVAPADIDYIYVYHENDALTEGMGLKYLAFTSIELFSTGSASVVVALTANDDFIFRYELIDAVVYGFVQRVSDGQWLKPNASWQATKIAFGSIATLVAGTTDTHPGIGFSSSNDPTWLFDDWTGEEIVGISEPTISSTASTWLNTSTLRLYGNANGAAINASSSGSSTITSASGNVDHGISAIVASNGTGAITIDVTVINDIVAAVDYAAVINNLVSNPQGGCGTITISGMSNVGTLNIDGYVSLISGTGGTFSIVSSGTIGNLSDTSLAAYDGLMTIDAINTATGEPVNVANSGDTLQIVVKYCGNVVAQTSEITIPTPNDLELLALLPANKNVQALVAYALSEDAEGGTITLSGTGFTYSSPILITAGLEGVFAYTPTVEGPIEIAVSAVDASGTTISVIGTPLQIDVEPGIDPAASILLSLETIQTGFLVYAPLVARVFEYSNYMYLRFLVWQSQDATYTLQSTGEGTFDANPVDLVAENIWHAPIRYYPTKITLPGQPHRITVQTNGEAVYYNPTFPSGSPAPGPTPYLECVVTGVYITSVVKLTSTSIRVTFSGAIDVTQFDVKWLRDDSAINTGELFEPRKHTTALLQVVSPTVSDWSIQTGAFEPGHVVGNGIKLLDGSILSPAVGVTGDRYAMEGGMVGPTASASTPNASSILPFLELLNIG